VEKKMPGGGDSGILYLGGQLQNFEELSFFISAQTLVCGDAICASVNVGFSWQILLLKVKPFLAVFSILAMFGFAGSQSHI
jgi:hypothetical protein